MSFEEFEEWELIATKAASVAGTEQVVKSDEFNTLLDSYLQSKKDNYDRCISNHTNDHSSGTDVTYHGTSGCWRSRRSILNKVIDLHEKYDDLDEYGFPLSGPFSLLSMKMRHSTLYDDTVGNDNDVSIGSGNSVFGNNFYLNIGMNTKDQQAPFDRGGLVAKLAWGLLQKETYDHKGAERTIANEESMQIVTNKLNTSSQLTKQCDNHYDMDNQSLDNENSEDSDEVLDSFNTQFESLNNKQRTSLTNIDINLIKGSDAQRVNDLKLNDTVERKLDMRESYINHIEDKEEAYEIEMRNAERLRRIADGMKRNESKVTQKEKRTPENLINSLRNFAAEVHYLFVNGQDIEAEDEFRDILDRNAEKIRDQLDFEDVINRNIVREEHYFNE